MIGKFKNIFNSENKHVSEIIKGSGVVFIAKIFATGLGLISSLIVARYYGANMVGLVAIITSILTLLNAVSLVGTQVSILRLIPEYAIRFTYSDAFAVYRKLFSLVSIFSILTGIFLYLTTPLIIEYVFQKESLAVFLFLAVPFILIRALNALNTEALRGLQKTNLYAMALVLSALINVILISLATAYYYRIENPIYIMFITSFAMFGILLFLVLYSFPEKKIVKSKVTSLDALSLSFPMFLTSLMGIVMTQTDVIMLGIMVSEQEVGVYSIVAKLALLTTLVLTAVNSIVASKFSVLYHGGDIESLEEVAQKASKLIFFSTLPIVVIYVLGGWHILRMFGMEFTQGYMALLLLTIGQFINAAVGSVGYFLDMTGGQKVFRNIVIIGALLNIFLNIMLIPDYGINGAAFASMVSMVLWNIAAAVYIRYQYGFYISYIPFVRLR